MNWWSEAIELTRFQMVMFGLAFLVTAVLVVLAVRWVRGSATRFSGARAQQLTEAVQAEELSPDVALIERLTERELETLLLMVEGLTNKEIAEKLFVTAQTVKSHVSSILVKLGCENRTQAAGVAIRAGLAPSPA
jgi:DNA-binding NarL/FixJ family response regulator